MSETRHNSRQPNPERVLKPSGIIRRATAKLLIVMSGKLVVFMLRIFDKMVHGNKAELSKTIETVNQDVAELIDAIKKAK